MPSEQVGRACAAAIAALPRGDRDAAAQDLLDILAVARGMKPVAVAGYGFESAAFQAKAAEIAAALGLATFEGAAWRGTSERSLPDWYRAAAGGGSLLFVGRDIGRLSALAGANLSETQEAATFGYPLCCVMEFHRRQSLFHLISRRMIKRQANGDEDLMRRLAQAQAMLTPRTETELKLLQRATRAVFAPYTSVAMCGACEADSHSPARALSARYEPLAQHPTVASWFNLTR